MRTFHGKAKGIANNSFSNSMNADSVNMLTWTHSTIHLQNYDLL